MTIRAEIPASRIYRRRKAGRYTFPNGVTLGDAERAKLVGVVTGKASAPFQLSPPKRLRRALARRIRRGKMPLGDYSLILMMNYAVF